MSTRKKTEPKMYPLAPGYHATVKNAGMGWMAYQIWGEQCAGSYHKVINTRCRARDAAGAVEHAKKELAAYLARIENHDLAELLPDSPDACELCGGAKQPLGVLGRTAHYRCRDCGIDSYGPATAMPEVDLDAGGGA